jgi:hypothetical protein
MMIRTAFVSAVLLVTGPSAGAQTILTEDLPGWTLTPSVQALGFYEDNVILNTQLAEGTFARVTPAIDARYRGPVGSFNVGYSLDREVHSYTLKAVDDLARQVGLMSFDSKTSEKTSLFGNANFVTTERPEEVFDAANLLTGIRRTTRLLGNLGVDHAISPKWRGNMAYTITLDDFGEATDIRPGARTILSVLSTAFSLRKTERTNLAIENLAKNVTGEERTLRTITKGLFWSDSLYGRVTRVVSPHVSVNVAAGPRLTQVVPAVIVPSERTPTEWSWQAELFASIVYKRIDQSVGLTYARTLTLGYGASGFVETDSIESRAAWLVKRRLRLTARPGFYVNTLAGQSANSYRFDAYASYLATDWMSLDATINYKHQDRAVALTGFEVNSILRNRTRNRIAVGITFRHAIRME